MAFIQALVTVLALLAGTLPHKHSKNSVPKKVSIDLGLPWDGKVGSEGCRIQAPSGVRDIVFFTALGWFNSPFLDWR